MHPSSSSSLASLPWAASQIDRPLTPGRDVPKNKADWLPKVTALCACLLKTFQDLLGRLSGAQYARVKMQVFGWNPLQINHIFTQSSKTEYSYTRQKINEEWEGTSCSMTWCLFSLSVLRTSLTLPVVKDGARHSGGENRCGEIVPQVGSSPL